MPCPVGRGDKFSESITKLVENHGGKRSGYEEIWNNWAFHGSFTLERKRRGRKPRNITDIAQITDDGLAKICRFVIRCNIVEGCGFTRFEMITFIEEKLHMANIPFMVGILPTHP